MDQKRTDTANEPVDTQDNEFVDTGVLHEEKVFKPCTDEACELPHPHPKES